jgi:hypothetical protein
VYCLFQICVYACVRTLHVPALSQPIRPSSFIFNRALVRAFLSGNNQPATFLEELSKKSRDYEGSLLSLVCSCYYAGYVCVCVFTPPRTCTRRQHAVLCNLLTNPRRIQYCCDQSALRAALLLHQHELSRVTRSAAPGSLSFLSFNAKQCV